MHKNPLHFYNGHLAREECTISPSFQNQKAAFHSFSSHQKIPAFWLNFGLLSFEFCPSRHYCKALGSVWVQQRLKYMLQHKGKLDLGVVLLDLQVHGLIVDTNTAQHSHCQNTAGWVVLTGESHWIFTFETHSPFFTKGLLKKMNVTVVIFSCCIILTVSRVMGAAVINYRYQCNLLTT